jgi:carbamoyltransferase
MSPYLGITYTDEDIEQAVIENEDVVYAHRMDYKTMIQVSSTMLLNNKVIGWFQGGSETGPRALGNRSIIANPSKKWIVEYINSEIKKREWYRPFAPSVLYKEQGKIFELDTYSPYMLVTTKVKKEWQDKIPAVTHFDGTSRYQSVTPDNNKIYYDVINAFYKKSGIPVVLNTSFNGAEEPIVETPADAIKTMFKNNLYAVVINNYIVYRK